MYALSGYTKHFKFKQKYQQHGPYFQTIFPFLMTMIIQSIEKKQLWKSAVTLPQQQKTFITLSIERKVCIIGVEIRQPVVKIWYYFLNHHVSTEPINTWLNYILELIGTKLGLSLAFLLDTCVIMTIFSIEKNVCYWTFHTPVTETL